MKLVYQVAGRLPGSAEDYSVLDYRVGDRVLEDFQISSDAIRALDPENTRVTIVFPVSLFYDHKEIIGGATHLQELEGLFQERFREYMKGPFDSFVIQSMGRYKSVEFKSDYDLIVLRLLARMIRDYLEYRPNEVLVDISTGLNVNVSALLEAFRFFLIWVKLFTYGQEKGTRFYRAFSELVMEGEKNQTYRIHIKETNAKAFFLSPLNVPDLDRLPEGVNSHLLRRFLITFTALYRNAPLYIYHAGFDRSYDIYQEMERLLERILYDTGVYSLNERGSVEFPITLDRRMMTSVLLALALYWRISHILEEHLGEDYQKRYRSRGISTEELERIFVRSIYPKLYLEMNAFLLNNELDNIREAVGRDKKIKGLYSRTFYPLSPAFTGNLSRDQCSEDYMPNPRNFLAHSGFERCLVEAYGNSRNLHFRYKKGVEPFIEKALLEIDPTF